MTPYLCILQQVQRMCKYLVTVQISSTKHTQVTLGRQRFSRLKWRYFLCEPKMLLSILSAKHKTVTMLLWYVCVSH
jgi:hypothetical protein